MKALLIAGVLLASTPLEVGKFSAAAAGATLPDGWKPLTFRR